MNTYTKKQIWKLMLFLIAVAIGLSSLLYTNKLVKTLSQEEIKKIKLWAEGVRQIANIENLNQDISFVVEVITNNKTVPVILVDEEEKIITSRNLDTSKMRDEKYIKKQLSLMKKTGEKIEIELAQGHKNFVYYRESTLLSQLFYYPFIQLGVIFLFILVSYFAFSVSRKAEQHQVWVGMSKETAHQLGTPISSLMAWIEILKLQNLDEEILKEISKDVKRLELISDRFSKIGSKPKLENLNLADILKTSVKYLKTRTSKRVKYILNLPKEEIIIPINLALFEWVIENLCKNAVDAMNGLGQININLINQTQVIYIDIKDTGKGILKTNKKNIFKPGFTTKKRGWGLGLSLTKRIIETHHGGKIFVKNSEVGKGTSFRIVLKTILKKI